VLLRKPAAQQIRATRRGFEVSSQVSAAAAQVGVLESETDNVRVALTRGHRRLRPHEVDEIVRLYGDGMSLTVIGQRYGAHRQTIRRHLERRGIAMGQEFVNERYQA
jgi:Helix-turn-helix domain